MPKAVVEDAGSSWWLGLVLFFFSSRRRHTRCSRDWSSDVCSSDLDSIRRLGAKGRAGVEVDLEFRLGAHEYRVKRGLSTAVLHQDGQVIANSLKAVTDKLERTLGMTHDEFFNTYFTGQKELAVMAALGKTERAAFLSRVLGYERLREAQE